GNATNGDVCGGKIVKIQSSHQAPVKTWRAILNEGQARPARSVSLYPPKRGENFPNDSRIEPQNPNDGASFLPLLAKRGEGRGEEPQGTWGNSFDVRRSVLDVRCSRV